MILRVSSTGLSAPRIVPDRAIPFTTTKKNLSPVLGLEGYSSILSQMKEANIEIPVVAIGGITFEDIPAILHTGVNGKDRCRDNRLRHDSAVRHLRKCLQCRR